MSAQVPQGQLATAKQVAAVNKGFMAPTPPNYKMHVAFKRWPKRYRRKGGVSMK